MRRKKAGGSVAAAPAKFEVNPPTVTLGEGGGRRSLFEAQERRRSRAETFAEQREGDRKIADGALDDVGG